MRLMLENNRTRIFYSPSGSTMEYRCAECSKWVDEFDAVWSPQGETGRPYHVYCLEESDVQNRVD
jgi:hypothetical protein